MNSTAGRSPRQELNWARAATEFSGNHAFYQALSEASYSYHRPMYGHLAGEYAAEIGRLYAEMARVSEWYADQCRALDFADRHPRCEGDCGEACEVGRDGTEVRASAPVIVLADIADRTDVA